MLAIKSLYGVFVPGRCNFIDCAKIGWEEGDVLDDV